MFANPTAKESCWSPDSSERWIADNAEDSEFAFGVHPVYTWLARYRCEGSAELRNRSSRLYSNALAFIAA